MPIDDIQKVVNHYCYDSDIMKLLKIEHRIQHYGDRITVRIFMKNQRVEKIATLHEGASEEYILNTVKKLILMYIEEVLL